MPADALPADSPPQPAGSVLRRLAGLVPSRRSLMAGAAIIAIAAGAYAIASETSLFAIRQVDVTGGPKFVDAQVTRTLAPVLGRSLVGLDAATVLQRVEVLPTVVSATYDRSFPSTLHVLIVPERPIAVLRDGSGAWVVSARGRVMRPVATDGARTLPRIWAAKKSVRVGETLPRQFGGTLAGVLTEAGSLRPRIAVASLVGGQLVFHLRSGINVLLGSPTNVALKVAVAWGVLRQIPSGTRTIDVSVPSRTVASPY